MRYLRGRQASYGELVRVLNAREDRPRLEANVESLPLLGVIGAFWASSSTFLNLHQELNRTRDAVLGYPLPPRSTDHRRLLLFHDWIPLWRFTIMLSAAVGISAIILALVLGADYRGGICILFGVVTLFISISWLVQGRRDLQAMTEQLAGDASVASPSVEMAAR